MAALTIPSSAPIARDPRNVVLLDRRLHLCVEIVKLPPTSSECHAILDRAPFSCSFSSRQLSPSEPRLFPALEVLDEVLGVQTLRDELGTLVFEVIQ
jgi:hypothetical protein